MTPSDVQKPVDRKPASSLVSVLGRNIRALKQRRDAEDANVSYQERIARGVTDFTGSMPFVYLHVVIVAFWVACNVGWLPGIPAFDNSFVLLATVTSVEAIFLSTFVLITQNRAAAAADRRDELDLQINLLAEHELTRLMSLTKEIAARLGVEAAQDPEIRELEQDVRPEAVLDSLQRNRG